MFQQNVACKPLKQSSVWRRISLVTWEKPQDPSVYGLLEIDATKSLELIQRLRGQTAQKITLTPLLIKATAKMLERFPEINVLIRNDRLYLREHVDIFVQVFLEETAKADLSGAKVRDAHLKSLEAIAKELEDQSQKIRGGDDPNLKRSKNLLRFLSPRLLKWTIKILGTIGYDWNILPGFLKLPPDPFGAVMISNVGMFGLKMGWAPLVPFSRTPMVLVAGEVTDQPIAQNGQILIKPILNIGVTVDHRIIDGHLGGKVAAYFKKLMEEPEQLMSS